MATKEKQTEGTVEVPASLLEKLMARLDTLEQANRVNTEILANGKAKILDPDYEAWKREVARPAAERSQDIADAKYGKEGKRFRVFLDSTAEDGEKGPNVSEHPALVISAHSDLEAEGRWKELTGIRKHDYQIKTEMVQAA